MPDRGERERGLASTDIVVSWLPWAVAMITGEREILFVNNRGRSFLDSHKGIHAREGRFHLDNPKTDNALRYLILDAVSARPKTEGRIAVPGRDGRVHFVIRVLPCRTAQEEPAALLIVSDVPLP